MRAWASKRGGTGQGDYFDLKGEQKPKIPLNCHTHACAIGVACLSQSFRKDGLSFEINNTGTMIPTFENQTNWGAITRLFDIEDSEAKMLFNSESYRVVKGAEAELAVANRILDFVAGHIGVGSPRFVP